MPFIACSIAITIGILLGNWQTRRAAEKEAIEQKLLERESAPPLDLNRVTPGVEEAEYRRVHLKGEFLPRWSIYLDNRPYQGVPGFYVLTPFRIDGTSKYVLVMRGWFKRDIADRTKLPDLKTPGDPIDIEGMVRRNASHVLQLGTPLPLQPGAILQNVEIAQFTQASGLPVQPYFVEQTSDTGDGLVRDWPRPSSGVDKHKGYAFQWYALSAMALIFFMVTGLRRGSKQAS